MPGRDYAKEMEFLEWKFYGPGARYLSSTDRNYFFGKADADVTTSVTGVYNPVFGADVWYQTNHEANAFGVLPKFVATKSGWRVITADAGTAADGGVAQNGAVPDTVKPTWLEVSTVPKTVAHAFGASEVHQVLSTQGDDMTGDMESNRKYFASLHRLRMNEMLLRDVDSTAGDRLESIDRVCSSNAEVTNLSLTAGDADIYGLDRDGGAAWHDAYVDDNSGTDRDLTAQLLLDMMDNTREAGAMSTLWMTGTDTDAAIQALFEPQVRYHVLKETKAQLTVNGVQTNEGIDVGITISTLFGLPKIISKDVTKDTISRVFLLDTGDPEGFGQPRLGIRVNKPTQYFESGISTGDPFAINKFGDQGVYRTMAELIAARFDVQGKLRDLQ